MKKANTPTKIQNWLAQRNITLQAGFADELQRLAATYKKTGSSAS